MATQASNTLNGLVQINDLNMADINVTDLLQDAPVLARMVAVPASQGGTLHKYIKQVVAAGAAFRAVNTGIANAPPQQEDVEVVCKYLDGSFQRDIAIADGYRGGRGAYMQRETGKAILSLFAGLEKQILQGVDADANGFAGLRGNTFVSNLHYSMVVDAGGNGGRSAWLVRSTEDDVAIVAGNDGVLQFDFDPESLQFLVTNTSTGAGYNALSVALGGWFAVQYGSQYSLGRIANIDGTSSHTLTDALIAKALSKFPASKKPNLIVMDPLSHYELQASRTATSMTGAPAPFPTESHGIPIVTSDHLKVDESALVTTTTTTTTTTTE
jgi:hypothetical protein